MSAANVSKAWIGLEAEKLFEASLKRDIHFVNDADAAGVAEARYGAAKGKAGLVILTTLGTGIGTAFLYNGTLIPNTELGHMELGGKDAETRMSYAAKERKGLSWADWAKRLQTFYAKLEMLFSPTLFIVGGGVSKSDQEFLPLLEAGHADRPGDASKQRRDPGGSGTRCRSLTPCGGRARLTGTRPSESPDARRTNARRAVPRSSPFAAPGQTRSTKAAHARS